MLDWARQKGRHAILMSESTRVDAPRTRLREAIKSIVVQQFDAALVGGEPQRAYVEELGMPAERVFIGYDVVDNDFWSAQVKEISTDPESYRRTHGLPQHYFLASARFIEKKNLNRLIEAFASYHSAAREDAWKLVLLGDGELRTNLERKVATLHIEDAVIFSGFQQIDKLPIYYALAGCFLHVSTIEQWGLVVNEAMACGLPVIVSETCGCAHDLVRDGFNGFVVDPYEVGEIADRLLLISTKPTLRRDMGERSARIIQDFSPATFAKGLIEAIQIAGSFSPKKTSLITRLLIRALAIRGGETGR
jgi:glycosyltransferase involved in cell wall biosynthesis